MSANSSKPADIWTLGDFSTPWSIHVVVTLRIAQHIAEGRREIGELAAAESELRVGNTRQKEGGRDCQTLKEPDRPHTAISMGNNWSGQGRPSSSPQ